MWTAIVKLAVWLFGLLTGKGRQSAAPTPAAVVSEQAQTTPTLAATAARDEQKVADVSAAVAGQEASHDQDAAAVAAAADARARIVRDAASVDADPAGHWRD